MESIQGRVPLETYRNFQAYMDRNGIESRSEALRQLLNRALFEDALLEQMRREHQQTRLELERLVAFVAGNLGRTKPLQPAQVEDAIKQIASASRG